MHTVLLAALLAGIPVLAMAQGWTTPVNLGPTSSGTPPQLTMNSSGAALVAFGYTPAATNIGSIGVAAITGTQPWTPATFGFSAYDAINPALGLDDSGLEYLVFTGGQYDNYNSIVDGCFATSPGIYTSCALIGTNVTAGARGRVLFTQPAATPVAVLLTNFGCTLQAKDTAGGAAQLNPGTDCTALFTLALNRAGLGAAVFSTKGGTVAAATRAVGGGWSASTTLVAKGSLAPAAVAASTAPSGETKLAYVLGKPGGKTNHVFTVTVSAAGALGQPVLQTATACAVGLALASRPDGGFDLLYGSPGTAKGTCEATRATALAGGAFGQGTALTTGAHAGTIAMAETATGNLAVLYTDTAKGSLMATNSSGTGFTTPVKLAAQAVPVVQAGGSTVNAAWCLNACFASTLVLP